MYDNLSPLPVDPSLERGVSTNIKLTETNKEIIMLPEFSIQTASQLVNSNQEFPVDFDRVWRWLGYSEKRTAKQFLLKNLELDIDYTVLQPPLGTLAVPNPERVIQLTVEAFKMWAMMAGTAQGKQVRLYFLECEKQLKQERQLSISKLPEVDQSKLIALTTQAVGVLAQAAQLSSVVQAQLCYKAILSIAPELEQHLTAVQHLIGGSLAVIEQPFYLPGELGSQVSKSAIAINKMLIMAGLQVKNAHKRSKTEPDYQATNLGKPHSDYLLNTGHAKDNSTYQQLKWKASVLKVIMPELTAAVAS